MRKKLFSYFLIAIIFSSAVSLITITLKTQNFYKKETSEMLKNIAYAIDKQLSVISSPDFDYYASYYSEIYSNTSQNIRLTFIDFDGKVLGESDFDQNIMDNHLMRSEVQKALIDGSGYSVRHSDTLDIDLMYAAVKSDINNIIIRVSIPFRSIANVENLIINYALLSGLIGILISLAVAFSLSNHFIRPLKAFSKASISIYEGDLESKVYIDSSDKEIQDLVYLFNSMTGKLKKTIDSLIEENIKISSIIDAMVDGMLFVDPDKKVLLINQKMKSLFNLDPDASYMGLDLLDVIRNRKLNRIISDSIDNNEFHIEEFKIPAGKKDLIYRIYTSPVKTSGKSIPGVMLFMQDITEKIKLEHMRSDFVSNVTHELKTPLTSIKGFIDTLRNGAINDKTATLKFLEIIEIESDRLTALINDILTLSEIESGAQVLDIKNHHLKVLVNNVFNLIEPNAQKKDISLINEVASDVVIKTDKVRFNEMLINLIDNAVKYNNHGGYVKVGSSEMKGLVEITIEDNGTGIDEKHLDRIFERFYRIDKGRSSQEGSTGLGLSIVKHIARMFNGDVRVKSELGKGSVFTITIPR